jgi:hypothetical protein
MIEDMPYVLSENGDPLFESGHGGINKLWPTPEDRPGILLADENSGAASIRQALDIH